MKLIDNITGKKFDIFTGVYKPAGKEIYRKSIAIVFYKKMLIINLWKVK